MPEPNNDYLKGVEDVVDVTRSEDPALGMEEFLEFVHETTYKITEQLFDNLDKVLEISVITVTQWVVFEGDGTTSNQDFIHNTRYHRVTGRNNIFPACDVLIEALKQQYEIHKKSSNSQFIKGLVMKLESRINKSFQKIERTRKYKGSSYIDHFDVPCFTIK